MNVTKASFLEGSSSLTAVPPLLHSLSDVTRPGPERQGLPASFFEKAETRGVQKSPPLEAGI